MSHFIPVTQSHMSLIKRGELEAVRILHPHFNAVILIQGGQLIEFSTVDRPDNWLWLGDKVQYKKGTGREAVYQFVIHYLPIMKPIMKPSKTVFRMV